MFDSLRNWPTGELRSLPRDFLRSFLVSAPKGTFDNVRTFCVFLGHSRSGHSILAALLDAHRNIVLADEIRSLKHVAAGFSSMMIYKLILQNSIDISSEKRERAGYEFEVPNQWQGKYESIHVIGDKDGSWTATLALRNFRMIEALFTRIPADIRIIHLYRNPYDVISTIYRRHRAAGNPEPLQHAINYYFRRTTGVEMVRKYAGSSIVLDLSHEGLIAEPTAHLERTCEFLSVDAPPNYLSACAKAIFGSRKKSRHEITWNSSDIAQVSERKAHYEYLASYTFDD